jgi:hypothetical protein
MTRQEGLQNWIIISKCKGERKEEEDWIINNRNEITLSFFWMTEMCGWPRGLVWYCQWFQET